MVHLHKQDLKSLRQEMREKEEAYEERIEQLEVQLQVCTESHRNQSVYALYILTFNLNLIKNLT